MSALHALLALFSLLQLVSPSWAPSVVGPRIPDGDAIHSQWPNASVHEVILWYWALLSWSQENNASPTQGNSTARNSLVLDSARRMCYFRCTQCVWAFSNNFDCILQKNLTRMCPNGFVPERTCMKTNLHARKCEKMCWGYMAQAGNVHAKRYYKTRSLIFDTINSSPATTTTIRPGVAFHRRLPCHANWWNQSLLGKISCG